MRARLCGQNGSIWISWPGLDFVCWASACHYIGAWLSDETSLLNPFIRAQISLLQLSAFLDPPDLGDMADIPQRPCEMQWFLCHGCYFLCTDTSLLYIPGDQNCSNSVRVRGSCWGYYILQVLSVTNFGAFITRHLSDVKAPNWNNYTWK